VAKTPQPLRVVVLGDLTLAVVLAPARPLERGTDVPGRAMLRQGGSAANTARWLGRLGARSTLICAVGRDAAGRSLVAALRADGVRVRAQRIAGSRTGRIGVLVEPGGERSFVADRAAADRLGPRGIDALHLPAYSLLGTPLGDAGLAASRLARTAGAFVTVDLASVGPLLERGRRAALALIGEAAPDLLFATAGEAAALVGARRADGLLDLAPIAVIKRGQQGATVLARVHGGNLIRLEIATTPLNATDTTGAGDAFDAGFLAAWLGARGRGLAQPAALRRGAVAGNRTALRHLSHPSGELQLG
jgi:sugar/nucleoside kinase (ribokinase family)